MEKKTEGYALNVLREKKINGKYLITTEHGDWACLGKEEYDLLKKKEIPDESFLKDMQEKGIIINEKNKEDIKDRIIRRYSYLYQGTSLHIVVPTMRCNHRCIYCHSSAKAEDDESFDMDEKTAEKTVDFIFQSPAKNIMIEFQGGEPLLNLKVVKKIIEYAQEKNKEVKKNLEIALVSNFSLMTNEILDYMVEKGVSLCTSLDGPENVHNKNRIYSGGNSYEKTTYWIKEMKKKGVFVGALMVTTKHSLAYWKEIIDEYVKNDIDQIKIRPLNMLGFAKESEDIGYSAEEYIDFFRKSIDYIIEINEKYPLRDSMVELILKKMQGIPTNFTDLESPCGAAIGQLAYNYNGNIHTCDEGKSFDIFRIGNIFEDNYKEVLTSDKVCDIVACSVNDCLLCDNCVYKPYCGVCPVCNYAKTGNLIPMLSRDDRCKINKAVFDYIFEKFLFDEKARKVFMKWMEMQDIKIKNC